MFLWLIFVPHARNVQVDYKNWRTSPELRNIITVRASSSSARLHPTHALYCSQLLTVSLVFGWSLLTYTLWDGSGLAFGKSMVGGEEQFQFANSATPHSQAWLYSEQCLYPRSGSTGSHSRPAPHPRVNEYGASPRIRAKCMFIVICCARKYSCIVCPRDIHMNREVVYP